MNDKTCPICDTILDETNTNKISDIEICEDCYFDKIDDIVSEQLIF